MNVPNALDSLLYEPDEAERRSPQLQARKLQLNICPSPPLDATQVKPTRGDAVLLMFMGDGKNPEIANTAGTQVLDDDSIDDDEDYESDPEEEERKEEKDDCMDETPDTGTLVVPCPASPITSKTQQGEQTSIKELMGLDVSCDHRDHRDHRDYRDYRDPRDHRISCSRSRSRSPSTHAPGVVHAATSFWPHAFIEDSIDPRSIQDGLTSGNPDVRQMMAVATAALSTAQQAGSRPAVCEQISRDISPAKLRSMSMRSLTLEDRTVSFSSNKTPSFGCSGSSGPPSNTTQHTIIDSPQTLESSSQLLTPASITTPQDSSSMLARDDRPVNNAASKESLVTPPSMSSPNEYSAYYDLPKRYPTTLPTPLPPIHQYGEKCNTTPSPTSLSGGRESTQMLPSIHQLISPREPDPAGEDQRSSSMTSPYGRSIAHAHGHLPTTNAPSLPGMSSITQGQSPPISPHNLYRRDSDLGGGANPYCGSTSTYGMTRAPGLEYGNGSRHESAVRGVGDSASLRARMHPSLAPATTMPEAIASAPVPPAPRRFSSGSVNSQNSERKMVSEVSMPTNHTNHSNHATSHSTNHSTGGTFKCKVPGCPAAPFQTQYLLNSHANVHSSDRPHYCPVRGCPRSRPGHGFKRKNEMIRHGLVHESPGYVCPFCLDREHKYPRPDNLQRHVHAHHKEKPKDDPQLRDVLAQRPSGLNQRRRRRIV